MRVRKAVHGVRAKHVLRSATPLAMASMLFALSFFPSGCTRSDAPQRDGRSQSTASVVRSDDIASMQAESSDASTTQSAAEVPLDNSAPQELIVMTWNVEWMFDNDTSDNRSDLSREQSAPSAEYWRWKVDAVADAIAQSGATIVALQEIEGSQTLADICASLSDRYQQTYRYAFIQGSDRFTEQDVGLLQRSGLATYRRLEQTKTMFDSQRYYNISKHIVAQFRWHDATSPLTIMNMHLRAKADAEDERTRQGRLARTWLQGELDAGEDVIVLGDLNSEHAVGDVTAEMQFLLQGEEGERGPQMVDLLEHLPPTARRTHLILNKAFDRILVSPSLMADAPGTRDWVFSKIVVQTDAAIGGRRNDGFDHWDQRLTMSTDELDVSDHAPVIATFVFQ